MTFETGETIGDYQILGILGRGGMGAVYKVRNVLSDREEAMKVVLPGTDVPVDVSDRFLREIKIQASLQHPNIAHLRTAVRSGNSILMIMELIDGMSLDQKLQSGPLNLEVAFRVADDILGALAYAHSRGVVHRDIKPSNILITSRGLPKLTDFGIARAPGDNQITKSGMAIGSLPYMSPEQVMSKTVDERSDIYSFGITLYETLTGMRPFRHESDYSIMNAHLVEIPAPLHEVSKSVPREFSMVVMRALAKAPEHRYPSAGAFQIAVREAFFGVDDSHTMTLPVARSKAYPVISLDPKEVARVEARLTEALGPIAHSLVVNAVSKHATPESLARFLAKEIPGDQERNTFLTACGTGSGAREASSSPVSGAQNPQPIDPRTIDAARRALAPFVGPIAAILVSQAASRAKSPEEFREMLASEIDADRDRAVFLKSFHLPGF